MHPTTLFRSELVVGYPMMDHAALVELQVLDRIVFVCDKSTPAVIYKVSEESFAECKYDLSAEWVGLCSRGRKYVTVSLRNLGVGPTQAVFYPNKTYFFTSFSSGTKYGIDDKIGGLCEMGVRLILEVRDSSVRVPLKPRFSSGFHEHGLQVPVQRVSYGGMPEKSRQRLREEQTFMEVRRTPNKDVFSTKSYLTQEENDSNFLFGWPWFDSSLSRQILDDADNSRVQKKRSEDAELRWEPDNIPEYYRYSGASDICQWSVVIMVTATLFSL
ncbi:Ephrin RBD domain-containing protein [Trichostrongylus colubriformis]|uniref:Ephrin RBD domain-containing protein n=1 Tax=Trichostrongylus colubriformis TaxID=6319 RepID=A0AAN8EUQ1_TRICO